jgi:hypothetical protein
MPFRGTGLVQARGRNVERAESPSRGRGRKGRAEEGQAAGDGGGEGGISRVLPRCVPAREGEDSRPKRGSRKGSHGGGREAGGGKGLGY